MSRQKLTRSQQTLLHSLSELRMKLAQIDHKLDHLIKSCRRFYLTTDFSDSSHRECGD